MTCHLQEVCLMTCLTDGSFTSTLLISHQLEFSCKKCSVNNFVDYLPGAVNLTISRARTVMMLNIKQGIGLGVGYRILFQDTEWTGKG